jgi:hypothetical protein
MSIAISGEPFSGLSHDRDIADIGGPITYKRRLIDTENGVLRLHRLPVPLPKRRPTPRPCFQERRRCAFARELWPILILEWLKPERFKLAA